MDATYKGKRHVLNHIKLLYIKKIQKNLKDTKIKRVRITVNTYNMQNSSGRKKKTKQKKYEDKSE
jgi:hypothetical protein